MRIIIKYFYAIPLIFIAGCLSVTYNEFYDNQPLSNPQKLVSFNKNDLTFELDNGKRYKFISMFDLFGRTPDDIEKAFKLSEWLVELENKNEVDIYSVYVKGFMGTCGYPLAGYLVIPIFPSKTPRYGKDFIGNAKQIN